MIGGDVMWFMIQDKLYNLDRYNIIQGDVTPNDKTYLSLDGIDNVEVRIQMSQLEIDTVMYNIADKYKGFTDEEQPTRST